MIIHSKKKDYYDSCLKWGTDTTLHYVRKEEKIIIDANETKVPNEITSVLSRNSWGGLVPFVIGFCGKFYTGFEVNFGTIEIPKKFFIYSREGLKKYLDKSRENKKPYKGYRKYYRFKHNDEMYYAFINTNYTSDDIFVKVNVPILTYAYSFSYFKGSVVTIKTNVLLKDYQFYKVVDPFSAFQNVAQYLSNQLVNHEQIPEFEDDLKIHAHGFDGKSFRHPVRVSQLKSIK